MDESSAARQGLQTMRASLLAVIGRGVGCLLLGACVLQVKGGGLETFDRHALALRRVAVVTLVYDEENVSRTLFPAMLERSLASAGYSVSPDKDHAQIVIVPTAGRIGALAVEGGNAGAATAGNATRVGLLLSGYRADDWRALESTGKLPRPVWRIYESRSFGNSGFRNTCSELVGQCIRDLTAPR